MTARRSLALAALTALVLVGTASVASADPAKPSNYESRIVDAPDVVELEVRGGDAFLVLEAPTGVEVLVPGYDDDEDFSDWESLERYLRVLPDGTVQLNRNTEAYYLNATRYGAAAQGLVGADVPPDWQTIADDGRVAWHDHRIHWMSPVPPATVDTAGGVQDVLDYRVPVIVDGELTVATGDLDYVPDPSPLPVLLVALAGLVGGTLLARRDLRLGALAALVAGGSAAGVLVAAGIGLPAGYEVATPPVAIVAVGAVAPVLGTSVASLREGQRRGLVALGGGALVVVGVLATGLLDPLLGGGATGDGGFGNWWLRPTLPLDVLPELFRLSLVAATGVGAALVGAVLAEALAVPGGLDGLDGLDGPGEETDGRATQSVDPADPDAATPGAPDA